MLADIILSSGRTVAELRAAAERATPGPRAVRGCGKPGHDTDLKALCRRVRAADGTRCDQTEEDKQHAALWDRETCLWLLDRLAVLEAEVHECPTCGKACKQCQCTERQIEGLAAENTRLAARVKELETALEPFKDAAGWIRKDTDKKVTVRIAVQRSDHGDISFRLIVDDFRRAAALLMEDRTDAIPTEQG